MHEPPGARASTAPTLTTKRGQRSSSHIAREQPALHQLYLPIDDLSRGCEKKALWGRLQPMRVRELDDLAVTKLSVLLVSPDEDIVIPPLAPRSARA